MMNRRDLLKKMGSGSLAGLGLGVGLGLGTPARAADAPAGVEAAATNEYRWTLAGAQGLVGQQFWLNHPALGAIPLQLEAVTAKPAAPAADQSAQQVATSPAMAAQLALAAARVPQLEQFTLVFVGPAGTGAADGTYEMDNGVVGRFALFLAQGEKRTLANTYRAEFCLLA